MSEETLTQFTAALEALREELHNFSPIVETLANMQRNQLTTNDRLLNLLHMLVTPRRP